MSSILIRALIAVFLLVVSLASRQEAAVPTPDETQVHVPTVINNVTAQVLATSPAQIELNVNGYQPDGCDFPVHVDQSRDGGTARLEIYRLMPFNIMCAAVLHNYAETIHLNGTFDPGTYHVIVNDFSLDVTIPSS